ncbi:hypothetical protein [Paenibacillus sp. UNC451MF]|uniref:hypothetical protein n=1 Tax=Paenibacillus sp. UNC451MF TaxID=1449063 RepID=UPI00048A889E|nr:hypothetical protein [Paenibacillus sp. UNC451MF]
MKRRTLVLSALSLFIAVTALTACNKNTANSNDPGAKPATLQGESEHWKVKVDYTAKGSKLQEALTVEYKIDEKLGEAAFSVVHTSGNPLINAVAEPSLLKPEQPMTLDRKGEVTSWKDTEQVQVEWTVGQERTKEYITVVNKAAAATP